MKIILNAAPLRHDLTGIGTYTLRLAQGLEEHPDVARVVYFSRLRFTRSRPGVGGASRGKDFKAWFRNFPIADRAYSSVRNTCFRFQGALTGASLYHETNYLLMPFSGPSVATIYDISCLRYPQFHPKDRVHRMEAGMPGTLKRAAHLITISEFVRREIIETLGVSPNRVTAIHLGVDPVFRARPRSECEPVLLRHGLTGVDYLLTVGALEPRKNLPGLLAAYSRLPIGLRDKFPLVLVGPRGWLTDSLDKCLQPLLRRGQVRWLGYVSRDDLPYIYSAARAFAFPSFYEGFGLPPLEAMACGIPVLVSDRAALSEIVGTVGLRVAPDDIAQMSVCLERILTDEDLRRTAAHDGPRRAAQFSWGKFVDRTVDVYRKVLAGQLA